MAVHDQVLRAARRLCRERDAWTFRPNEVVRALPHLNPGSVRTHIVSRCCVNAPAHHPHRWKYFRRVAHGVYEIEPAYRKETARSPAPGAAHEAPTPGRSAGEAVARYGPRHGGRPRDTVHTIVTRDHGWYVAECLEIAVVTQGRTLDELVTNVRDAVALHLEGGEAAALGIAVAPRIAFTYEVGPHTR
jgi:predicted RNase H-like HicB family nuclease